MLRSATVVGLAFVRKSVCSGPALERLSVGVLGFEETFSRVYLKAEIFRKQAGLLSNALFVQQMSAAQVGEICRMCDCEDKRHLE